MEHHRELGEVSSAEISFVAAAWVTGLLARLGRNAVWSEATTNALIERMSMGGVRPQPLPPPPPPASFINDLVANLKRAFGDAGHVG